MCTIITYSNRYLTYLDLATSLVDDHLQRWQGHFYISQQLNQALHFLTILYMKSRSARSRRAFSSAVDRTYLP